MNKVVIDTNVIVSSIITPLGNSAMIMKMFFSGAVQGVFSPPIIDEYIKVLSYKRLGIAEETKNDIIDVILELGSIIEPSVSSFLIPDESDRIFYDTAKESGGTLITGNSKHYPDEPFIMTPSDFVALYANS